MSKSSSKQKVLYKVFVSYPKIIIESTKMESKTYHSTKSSGKTTSKSRDTLILKKMLLNNHQTEGYREKCCARAYKFKHCNCRK